MVILVLSSVTSVSGLTYDVVQEDVLSALYFEGHYYKIYNGLGLDWKEANEFCASLGGHLVTVTSEREQKYIESLLNIYGDQNNYWLGAIRSSNDEFEWVTMEPFQFANWAEWQPDNSSKTENCVMMYRIPDLSGHDLGLWNDVNESGNVSNNAYFGKSNFGFICEWDYCCISKNGMFDAHNWSEWNIGKSATCFSSGEETRKCVLCNKIETRSVEQRLHDYGEWNVVRSAMCDQTGLEERSCNLCGNIENREIIALSHDYSDYEIVSGSKLIPPIVKERKCNLCDKIDRINDWSYVWITALAGIAAVGIIVGIIGYIRAFKRK